METVNEDPDETQDLMEGVPAELDDAEVQGADQELNLTDEQRAEIAAQLQEAMGIPPAVDLVSEQAQTISDKDVVIANLRMHRENLAKGKVLWALYQAGVRGLPQQGQQIKDTVRNNRLAVDTLIELALQFDEEEWFVIPSPSDIEVPMRR